jgi:type I restriction enzyme S subunit
MGRWQTISFEQLYAEPSRNGLTRPKKVRGTGYKMVNMGEIFAYNRIRNPVMDLVPMNESEQMKYSLKPGDLLFARQSLVASGAGKCSIVLETPEITTFESHLIRVQLDLKKAVPLFYYYYFSSPAGKGNVQSLVMQVAAAGIRGSELAKLPVPHPPLPIQRKIAAILSAYDDLIENNTRRIEILEEMARSIYREWFVNFRFPGHEQVQMVDSELGLIPEGWEIKPVENLLSYHIGGGWGEEEQSNQYPAVAYVIRGTDIPLARLVSVVNCPLRFHKQSNFNSRKLELGDIVFEVSGGSKGQPVGRALLITQKLLKAFNSDVICASFCKLLRVNNKVILPELLYLHLLDIYSNGRIDKYQVQSTGITNFKFAFFLESEQLLVPPPQWQAKFNKIAIPIFGSIQTLGAKNANLRQTRDLLLPRLISGEIDVENLDINTGPIAA